MFTARVFFRDVSGSLVERVALSAAVLVVASVLGARILSSMLQKGELPVIAMTHPEKRPAGLPEVKRGGVDMTTTASIPAKHGAAPVSPCEKPHN